MPLYEYRCRLCHSHLEMLQRVGDKPLKICPKCGGELEKLISAASIQFKGTGWYITDYGRKGNSNESRPPGNGKDKESKEGEAEKAAPRDSNGSSAFKPNSSK